MPLITISNTVATPIWTIVAASPTAQILLVNQDTAANIAIGDPSVQIGDQESTVIPPQSSLSLPANQSWYAIADQSNGPILQVTLGGANWSTSPIQAAEAMLQAGIATDIAEAIFSLGIPQIAAPISLWDIGGTSGGSGDTGLVGLTIPQQAILGTGCSDPYIPSGDTQDQADMLCVSKVGRGIQVGGTPTYPTVTKKFWNLSDWSLTKNNLANYYAHGTKVILALKPLFTAGLALGSNFTTTGTTAQKNAAIAEVANLNTFLTGITGLGANSTNTEIVPWQEPANVQNMGHGGGNDFNNMLRTYGPTIIAAGFPITVNVNFDGATANATNFANAALGLRAWSGVGAVGLPVVTTLALDLYTNNAIGAGILPTTIDSNGDSFDSIAAAHGLIVSLNEFGCNPSTQSPVPNGYFSIQDCTTYFGLMQSYLEGVIQAGRQIGNAIYYESQCSSKGTGDITSPIGLDPNVPNNPDFRVALYQTMYDSLSTSTSSGISIPATHTTVIAPTDPSPGGSFGNADTISYEIALGMSAGAGSTNPFAIVTLSWFMFDEPAKDQVAVDSISWAVPLGTNGDANGPAVVYGGGRMRGSYLQIKINNQDSVACTLAFMQVTGTSRAGRRDSWRWDSNSNISPAIPGFTLASAGAKSLQVGRANNLSVPSNSTVTLLNGMYAGEVYIRLFCSNGGGANNANFTLQPLPNSQFGTENMLNQSVGNSPTEFEDIIALPRAPTTMTIKNNNGGASINVDYQIIAIETA